MSKRLSNKCPSCGSELSYNTQSQTLKCRHCDTSLPISIKAIANTKKLYAEDINLQPEKLSTFQYKCKSCGNTHSIVSEVGLKRCPSCGSSNISKKIDISIRPDGIIPFRISHDQAALIFKHWIKKRPFAPNDLKKLAKNKKLSASYYPAWNFDYDSTVVYSGVGIKTHSDMDGDTYTTSHPFNESIEIEVNNFFESANTKISGSLFRELGEFGLGELKEFQPELTFGWAAATNDNDIHASYKEFTKNAHAMHERKIKKDLNLRFSSVLDLRVTSYFKKVLFSYIYLPLWANHYTYKEKDYHCYINGYNGKAVGKSPKSAVKILLLVLGIAAFIATIYILTRF